MVLLRLNFMTEKAGGRLWVGPADVFLMFIKEWHQVDRPTVRVEISDRGGWMMKKGARRAHEKGKENKNEGKEKGNAIIVEKKEIKPYPKADASEVEEEKKAEAEEKE